MRIKIFATILLIAFVVAFSATAMAGVSGAAYTTTVTGTTVNGNIYDNKEDVYLNGGPQRKSPNGLDPDGVYYFQVTDPSGAVKLSSDDILCRAVQVTGGRVVGSVDLGGNCAHANGTPDPANGGTSVQLIPYDDTPNPGGEYKAWLTPVADYNPNTCALDAADKTGIHHKAFGFCDKDSKTDNFKIRASAPPGSLFLVVCKFDTSFGDQTANAGNLIQNWGMSASGTGVTPTSAYTDITGCTSFTVPSSTTSVVVTEDSNSDLFWRADVNYTVDSTGATVAGTPGSLTATVDLSGAAAGSTTTVFFGNSQHFINARTPNFLPAKTAFPKYNNTYTWTLAKSADKTTQNQSGTSYTFHYTITATHSDAVAGGWEVVGNIDASNNGGGVDANNVDVIEADPNCSIDGGSTNGDGLSHINVGTIAVDQSMATLTYHCHLSAAPSAPYNNVVNFTYDYNDGTGISTAQHTGVPAQATAVVDFSTATAIPVDDTAVVKDPLAITSTNLDGTLGTATVGGDNPASFGFDYTVTGTAGTCVTQDNTAHFSTTSDPATLGDSNKVTVQLCVAADPTTSKTAVGSFNSGITKAVDKTTTQEVSGGSVTFNYTVRVTESGWRVDGHIYVLNNNDWETISGTVSDPLCNVVARAFGPVAAGGTADIPYGCALSGVPTSASGINSVTGSWSGSLAGSGSLGASHGYSFSALHVSDNFDGTTVNLGTISAPAALTTYTYSHTFSALAGACSIKNNTATITDTGANASASATVCNTKTGALTMGFWQGPNGQKAIGTSTTGTCGAYTLLTGYAPFKDLISATKQSCAAVNSYISNVTNAANSSGSGGLMLKGQLMATLLTWKYGGNAIVQAQGTVSNLGAVKIALNPIKGTENVKPAFINYAAAAPNGELVSAMISDAVTNWGTYCSATTGTCTGGVYGNKTTLVLASDAFAFINQAQANIAP